MREPVTVTLPPWLVEDLYYSRELPITNPNEAEIYDRHCAKFVYNVLDLIDNPRPESP